MRPSRNRTWLEAPRYVSAGESLERRRRLRLALKECWPSVALPVVDSDSRPPPSLTSYSLRPDRLVARVGEYRTVSATGDRSARLPGTLLEYVGSYWLASVSE